jgi:hypothetical protein
MHIKYIHKLHSLLDFIHLYLHFYLISWTCFILILEIYLKVHFILVLTMHNRIFCFCVFFSFRSFGRQMYPTVSRNNFLENIEDLNKKSMRSLRKARVNDAHHACQVCGHHGSHCLGWRWLENKAATSLWSGPSNVWLLGATPTHTSTVKWCFEMRPIIVAKMQGNCQKS